MRQCYPNKSLDCILIVHLSEKYRHLYFKKKNEGFNFKKMQNKYVKIHLTKTHTHLLENVFFVILYIKSH